MRQLSCGDKENTCRDGNHKGMGRGWVGDFEDFLAVKRSGDGDKPFSIILQATNDDGSNFAISAFHRVH